MATWSFSATLAFLAVNALCLASTVSSQRIVEIQTKTFDTDEASTRDSITIEVCKQTSIRKNHLEKHFFTHCLRSST
jgi:hypothetical protein